MSKVKLTIEIELEEKDRDMLMRALDLAGYNLQSGAEAYFDGKYSEEDLTVVDTILEEGNYYMGISEKHIEEDPRNET